MVADLMTAVPYGFDQVRTGLRVLSCHKERRLHASFIKKVQQCRCCGFIRTVVKTQGNGLFIQRPPAHDWQKKRKPREERSGKGNNEKKNQRYDRQGNIIKGKCKRDLNSAKPGKMRRSEGKQCWSAAFHGFLLSAGNFQR